MEHAESSQVLKLPRNWCASICGLCTSGLKRRTEADWTRELDVVVSELERMSHRTEGDFLAITQKLAGFSSSARAISSGACGLVDAVAGEKAEGASQALVAVLNSARSMFKAANEASRLAEMRESVARIRRSLRAFERVGPSFQTMAALAQIETARLGSSGPDVIHLAAEFRSAGGDIRCHVDHILEGAKALERRIETAIRETSMFDAQSLRALPSLIETAECGVQELSAQRERSAATASRVAEKSELFSRAIADIVAFIQVHDITRQQVEHVADSLRQIRLEGSKARGSSRPPDGTAAVISLQLAQLANAKTAFVGAMHELGQRLVTVSEQGSEMAALTRDLLGSPGGCGSDDHSFFSRIESSFRAIADAASGCREIEERTRGAALELERALEVLEDSTREIHSVELRLRRLAINAAISAAHIGTAGEPLAIVAGAMRSLSAECEESSAATDLAIQSILDLVRSKAGGPEHRDVAPRRVVSDQLQVEIQGLQRVSREATERSSEIAQIAARLCSEVADLRGSVSAGSLFQSTIERCSEALGRIRTRNPGDGARVDSHALHRFEELYTMRAEREIHEGVVQPADALAIPLGGEVTHEEFGENVELF